jgi:hypothetical protein
MHLFVVWWPHYLPFHLYMTIMQLGAAPISPNAPIPSVDDLADQVADLVLSGLIFSFQIRICHVLWCHCGCLYSNSVCSMCFFEIICYIYCLFTMTFYWMMFSLLQSKYRERVLGLILVSPLCKGPTWTEWLYSKVAFVPMALCSLIYIFIKTTWLYWQVILSGDVQFAVLLWDVWVGEGMPTSAVLQQGRWFIFMYPCCISLVTLSNFLMISCNP